MGFCVAVTFVAFAVSIVAQLVVNIGIAIVGAAIPDPITISIIFVALYVLLFVLSIWIGMGQWLTYLKVAQGQPATMGDLFGGGSYVLKAILAFITVGFAAMGIVILGALPGAAAVRILGASTTSFFTVTNVITSVGLVSGFIGLLVF